MRRIVLLFLLLTATTARAQRLDPSDYVYPIEDVPGLCSANFGEMRPGHFHAGVDIKTDGVEGKPLVAVADGYISRAVITSGGYGRALYLTLKDGKTAVYGHLLRFRDDIEEAVLQERRRRAENQIDLSFDPSQWPVRQGERIGFSGNSGSSAGPHLHYELRNTRSDMRYNLVRERIITPEDDLPSRILRIHYIECDTLDGIPVEARRESYAVVRQSEGLYRLTREEPLPVGRRGFLVAEVSDRRNGVHNTFGIWRIRAEIDDRPLFEYRMDGFTYAQARLCDAVSYYPLQLTSRNECIRLAQTEGAPDAFYTAMHDRGLLRVAAGEERRIRIEVEDDSGNRSQLAFTVRGRQRTFRATADPTAIALRRDRTEQRHVGDSLTFSVPAGALHESTFCHPTRCAAPKLDPGLVALSPAWRIFDRPTPLFTAIRIGIRTDIPPALQLKAVAAIRTAKGALTCAGGTYADGMLTLSTRTAGEVMVVADTVAPAIRPLFEEGADLTAVKELRFRATDNFAGIASWRLEIDGERIPCDRYPMKARLFHRFDTPPTGTRHTVRLTVTDGCGNTARWSGSFVR